MTTAGQRLRRRRGSMPSSTEWSGLSSAVARSQRKWRKSGASSSCRCARWAPPQAVCHTETLSCDVNSRPVPCASVPAEGERDQREEKCGFPAGPHQVFPCPVQVRNMFLLRTRPSAVERVRNVSRSPLLFASVMIHETLQLSSLGAHPEGEIKQEPWLSVWSF